MILLSQHKHNLLILFISVNVLFLKKKTNISIYKKEKNKATKEFADKAPCVFFLASTPLPTPAEECQLVLKADYCEILDYRFLVRTFELPGLFLSQLTGN